MTPEEFIRRELTEGRLTYQEIVEFVKAFQRAHKLDPDGKPGQATQRALDTLIAPPVTEPGKVTPFLRSPMPVLEDGRKAVVTSAFRPKQRPNHVGLDYFYQWKAGDKPSFVGDKGCAGKTPNGMPKWVVPYETMAVAAADGEVMMAGNSKTGFRLWIDHGNGLRTGYFHLLNLVVAQGQPVRAGRPLGLVGDNPADTDGRHLHFELSPVSRYAPIDPLPYFIK